MQKTLLDNFAMAALTGWLATFRGNDSPSAELGSFCYDIAEIMMAERAKRLPAEKNPLETLRGESASFVVKDGMPQNPLPADSLVTLHDAVKSMKGRKVTCSEICQNVFGWEGDMTTLRSIGEVLRGMGFRKARSGGKDYYQL